MPKPFTARTPQTPPSCERHRPSLAHASAGAHEDLCLSLVSFVLSYSGRRCYWVTRESTTGILCKRARNQQYFFQKNNSRLLAVTESSMKNLMSKVNMYTTNILYTFSISIAIEGRSVRTTRQKSPPQTTNQCPFSLSQLLEHLVFLLEALFLQPRVLFPSAPQSFLHLRG